MTKLLTLSVISLTALLMQGCSKNEKENYTLPATSEYHYYLPLMQGQLQYYRLDSTVTAPFGTRLITSSHLAKDSVGQPSIDGQDTTYPVYRYLSDTLGQSPWSYLYTYRWVLRPQTVERIDDQNRRFIILANPVKEGTSWEGNRYFTSQKDQNDPYYGWEYSYLPGPDQVRINQINVVNGNNGTFDPKNHPGSFQQQKKAFVIFDKQGLKEKEISFITYQPNSSNPNAFGAYETGSYGVHLSRRSL